MIASEAFGVSNWKNEVDINWTEKDISERRLEGDDQKVGHVKFKMPISHPSEFVIRSLEFEGIQAGGKNVESSFYRWYFKDEITQGEYK